MSTVNYVVYSALGWSVCKLLKVVFGAHTIDEISRPCDFF